MRTDRKAGEDLTRKCLAGAVALLSVSLGVGRAFADSGDTTHPSATAPAPAAPTGAAVHIKMDTKEKNTTSPTPASDSFTFGASNPANAKVKAPATGAQNASKSAVPAGGTTPPSMQTK